MQNLIFEGLNGEFKIAAATQYITRIKDSTKNSLNAIVFNLQVILLTMEATELFVYLGFYVAFNTVQVISRRVVGRAEETSTYSSLGFCTVNCRPTASNYQLSHLRP